MRLAQGFFGLGIATVSGVAAFSPTNQLGFAGHGLRQGAQCHAMGIRCLSSLPLASSIKARHFPTTVLVHGLDSSKETWTGLLADLNREGYPAMALDLRGNSALSVENVVRRNENKAERGSP